MRVLLRVDANAVVGTGHFARCLCLANELAARGAAVRFACASLPMHLRELASADGHAVDQLENAASSGHAAEASWSPAEQAADARAVMGLLRGGEMIDLLVVDHYGLGIEWERALRTAADKLMVIDDLGREHDCDLLLDQNLHAHAAQRYAARVPVRCQLLLGPSFALLRPEFRARRSQRVARLGPVRRLQVFLGGADARNVTEIALRAIQLLPRREFAVDVIIGAMHPARRRIEQLCASELNMRCHVQVPPAAVATLLADCDLAIGAGGTATWERLALGVPTLALSLAENQAVLLDSLAQAGLVCAPDLADWEPQTLALHLQALLENQRLRQHLSAAGMALVDGNGASRVAAVAAVASLTLRRATAADSDRLFSWRNQEPVRLASHDPRLIASDEHQRWLTAALQSHSRHLLIGEANGRAVGVVRLDVDGGRAMISIYLVPEQHGKGAGASLLLAAEGWLRQQLPAVDQLVAEVRAGNARSMSLFERCGYHQSAISFTKRLSS